MTGLAPSYVATWLTSQLARISCSYDLFVQSFHDDVPDIKYTAYGTHDGNVITKVESDFSRLDVDFFDDYCGAVELKEYKSPQTGQEYSRLARMGRAQLNTIPIEALPDPTEIKATYDALRVAPIASFNAIRTAAGNSTAFVRLDKGFLRRDPEHPNSTWGQPELRSIQVSQGSKSYSSVYLSQPIAIVHETMFDDAYISWSGDLSGADAHNHIVCRQMAAFSVRNSCASWASYAPHLYEPAKLLEWLLAGCLRQKCQTPTFIYYAMTKLLSGSMYTCLIHDLVAKPVQTRAVLQFLLIEVLGQQPTAENMLKAMRVYHLAPVFTAIHTDDSCGMARRVEGKQLPEYICHSYALTGLVYKYHTGPGATALNFCSAMAYPVKDGASFILDPARGLTKLGNYVNNLAENRPLDVAYSAFLSYKHMWSAHPVLDLLTRQVVRVLAPMAKQIKAITYKKSDSFKMYGNPTAPDGRANYCAATGLMFRVRYGISKTEQQQAVSQIEAITEVKDYPTVMDIPILQRLREYDPPNEGPSELEIAAILSKYNDGGYSFPMGSVDYLSENKVRYRKHDGQRKLIASLLALVGSNPGGNLLYVGGAGRSVLAFASAFPSLFVVVVDPAPLPYPPHGVYPRNLGHFRGTLNEFIADLNSQLQARQWAVAFDHRSEADAKYIHSDNTQASALIRTLLANDYEVTRVSYKFRSPDFVEDVTFLTGNNPVLLPMPYSPINSTELRLISDFTDVDAKTAVERAFPSCERECAHFNRVVREMLIDGVPYDLWLYQRFWTLMPEAFRAALHEAILSVYGFYQAWPSYPVGDGKRFFDEEALSRTQGHALRVVSLDS
jgi:hypothetical protein